MRNQRKYKNWKSNSWTCATAPREFFRLMLCRQMFYWRRWKAVTHFSFFENVLVLKNHLEPKSKMFTRHWNWWGIKWWREGANVWKIKETVEDNEGWGRTKGCKWVRHVEWWYENKPAEWKYKQLWETYREDSMKTEVTFCQQWWNPSKGGDIMFRLQAEMKPLDEFLSIASWSLFAHVYEANKVRGTQLEEHGGMELAGGAWTQVGCIDLSLQGCHWLGARWGLITSQLRGT